jgi:hypothetical protein
MESMDKNELRQLVRETAIATARETLRGLGMDVDHPLEVQRDLQTLREWRTVASAARRGVAISFVGILVSGALAAFWIGFKSYFAK